MDKTRLALETLELLYKFQDAEADFSRLEQVYNHLIDYYRLPLPHVVPNYGGEKDTFTLEK